VADWGAAGLEIGEVPLSSRQGDGPGAVVLDREAVDVRRAHGEAVEAFLELRAMVRAEKRFDLSDAIRDALVGLGVEVRDGADGVTWILGD
jgi:cysteinyl-tRNA synthetase